MPLSQKSGFKANLVSFWRPNREEKKRKRRREEEEEKKRKEKFKQSSIKVWNFGFLVWKLTLFKNPMRLCMNFHALMVILLPKSRVFVRVSS